MSKKNQNKEKSKIEKENIDLDNIYPPSLMKYQFYNRRMPYGCEVLEYTNEEKNILSQLKPEKINKLYFPNSDEQKVKAIIDTDLGTDWDDAMAIGYALRLENLELLGITTNYGIPEIRAGLTKKIIEAYQKTNKNKDPIPVIAGASCQLGTHREIFIRGHEGLPFYSKQELINALDMNYMTKRNQNEAASFIVSTVKKYPGQIKIISIGIPTNIGLAIKNNPEIIPLIKEIVIMGCGSFINKDEKEDFDPLTEVQNGNILNLYPNHNISGDTMASKIIFDSKIPIKIINHSVTSPFWSKGEVINYFKEHANLIKDQKETDDFMGIIGLLMNEWFSIRRQDGQCPHDPLTIHEAVFTGDKSPLIYVRGNNILHEWAGFSTFIPQENGPHYLAVKIKENNNFLDSLSKTIINKEKE